MKKRKAGNMTLERLEEQVAKATSDNQNRDFVKSMIESLRRVGMRKLPKSRKVLKLIEQISIPSGVMSSLHPSFQAILCSAATSLFHLAQLCYVKEKM